MPQPRDFSHQDLRNRSFKNQNLVGADFSHSDLRGCNFRGANLIGASFQHAKMGQSRRQVLKLVVVAFAGVGTGIVAGVVAGVVAGAFAGVVAGIGTGAFIFAVAIAVAVAGVGTGAFVVAFAIAGASTVAVAFAARAISAFGGGAGLEGITYSSLALFLFFIAFNLFSDFMEMLKKGTGNDFRNADLTNADFSHAEVKNADFSQTKIDFVNWTDATFSRCQFPLEFEDSRVRSLCIRRNGRDQDYDHISLKSLNLQGILLSNATLTNANLNRADLRYANLEFANLSHTQALGTDFSDAILTGACIQNWGINPDTQFTNVRCDYIYLDLEKQERQPASGTFQPGDFEQLVHRFAKTLDFLFRHGIDPQAFEVALQNLEQKYGAIAIKEIIDLDGKTQLVRTQPENPQVDKAAMHSAFMQNYQTLEKQLAEARAQNQQLQQAVSYKDGQISIYHQQSSLLERFFLRPSIQANSLQIGELMSEKGDKIQFGNVGGDVSGIAGGDISGVAGKDQQGVAGGDISGTLTLTLGQLQASPDPKALELAELLTQLKTAIETADAGLAPKDKEKALKHLDALAKLGKERQDPDLLEKAGDALDALPTILQRGAGLVEFAEKHLPTITAGVKAILQFWGISV